MELNLVNLLLVVLAGWLAGWGTSRIGYPPVLGELLVGILLGPPMLGLLSGDAALAVLAEIGILLMMLYVGMEIDPRELGRASWAAFLAAIGGFITPFVLAYFTMLWFGASPLGATFVGIAAGVTSLTTKSRILVDLRLLDTRVAHVMMAGALISDTVSLIIFAGVLAAVQSGALDMQGVLLISGKVLVFFAITFFLGLRVFPVLGRRLTAVGLTGRTFHFTFVLILAVAFGELAHLAGLHAILGAFLAGLFLRENVLGRSLSHELMGAVRDASIGFLAPIFFVTAGFQVSLEVFRTSLPLLIAIVGVASIGKIAGTAAFYAFSGNGWREGLTIGGGMNGRGAVEIIVAGIALDLGLISTEIFSILVFMAIFTTATVPFLLKWGTDWLRGRGELVRSSEVRRGVVVIGAGSTARALARSLMGSRIVSLVDTNPARCRIAAAEGLRATCGNAFQEAVLGEAGTSEAQTLIAMTPNAEVNALVAQLARSIFLVPEIMVIHLGAEGRGHRTSMEHLHARRLFGTAVDIVEWDRRIEDGETVEKRLRAESDVTDIREWIGRIGDPRALLPLAIDRGGERQVFQSDERLRPGDELILLEYQPSARRTRDRFDQLVTTAPILDLPDSASGEHLFAIASEQLEARLHVPRDVLFRGLWEREKLGSTVLSGGLAVPHVGLEGTGRFELLIARSREGIPFPGQPDPVHAVFVMASTGDERTTHLRVLSAIAQIANDERFEERWRTAGSETELRDILLTSQRREI